MLKINKRPFITFSLITLISLPLFSQRNTYSPYSRYGLGEIQRTGFGQNEAMGGIAMGIRANNHINYLNPASYTSQDTMSFIFDFGIKVGNMYYKTNSTNYQTTNANLDHLAIGFPIAKWWKSSIGLVPFSTMGYYIKEGSSISTSYGNETSSKLVNYIYDGNGGLSQFYFGNAVEIGKHVSVGLNASYLFGRKESKRSITFPYDNATPSSSIDENTTIGDFLFSFGAQFYGSLNEHVDYTVGAMLENNTELNARQSIFARNTMPIISNGQQYTAVDTVLYTKGEQKTATYPTNLGIGLSLNFNKKILLGVDYYQQDWTNTTFMGHSDSLTNSNSIHAGLQYTPDKTSISSYLDRINYRLGGYYSNTYLKLRGHQINEYGISFGVGLPMPNSNTTFNFAFELGQRGSLQDNLIKETFGRFKINFTLYDFWFFKRKFD